MMIIWIIILAVLIRGSFTLYLLINSISWQKNNSNRYVKTSSKKIRFHILIPALREQKRIEKTLDYFLQNFNEKNILLTVITTHREFDKKFSGKSTKELVEDYINQNKCSSFIEVINYPDPKGRMAHQLNFAISKIKDNCYLAIYNADSRPDKNTFLFVSEIIQRSNAKVFQQPAVFLKNYSKLNYFLKASAILQSRWTFAHEIARLLRQSADNMQFLRKYAYAHVVGHGLIIEKNTLQDVGGFPTGTMTEDLFLGFLLRSKGFRIFPIPFLELADSPETIKGLWNQKYVWFWGPMKNISYLKYVINNKAKFSIKSVLPSFAFTIEGLQSALAWLVSGPFILALLSTPLFINNINLILLAYFVVFLYGPLQYAIFYLQMKSYIKNDSMFELLVMSILSIPAIIFNSIPPYFSIANEIRTNITKADLNKPKTDD